LTILKEQPHQEQRYESLQAIWDNSRIIDDLNDIAVLVKQTQYTSIDEVFQAYDQAIISGYEGLVMHKNSSYKMGHSLNSGMAYKIKDNLQFDGVILSLEVQKS
jgi:predicted RecB family endonuclease